LRYVAQLQQPEEQVELLQQVVQRGLTVKQVKEIVGNGYHVVTISDDTVQAVPRAAMQMVKMALKPDKEVNARRIAEAALSMERDRTVSKARLRALREMLEEAERYLDEG
jgi:UTP-glucose-1-phosphate uridylyltransferase